MASSKCLAIGVVLCVAGCGSSSPPPQTSELPPERSAEQKLATIEPYRATMADPSAHEACLASIKDELLDPTSLQITSSFEPDPDWLAGRSRLGSRDADVVAMLDDPDKIAFAAKMLARNRGGNLAPSRAKCTYKVGSGQPQLRFSYSVD